MYVCIFVDFISYHLIAVTNALRQSIVWFTSSLIDRLERNDWCFLPHHEPCWRLVHAIGFLLVKIFWSVKL